MKAFVGNLSHEKVLVGTFSVITNSCGLLFQALLSWEVEGEAEEEPQPLLLTSVVSVTAV